MNAPRERLAWDPSIERVLNRLRQAEVDLLAVVRSESHPKHTQLLEAHAFLRDAISSLSRADSAPPPQGSES